MGKIIVNGLEIEIPDGASVSIIDGEVSIDGKSVNKEELDAINKASNIIIEGDVNNITTDKSVKCRNVKGDITCEGSVHCDDVKGDVNADGSVQCDNVGGFVNADGSVQCDNVGGNVSAGGSIVHK